MCVVFSELTFNSNNNNKKKLVRFQCDFSCTFSEKYTLMSSPGVQQSQEVERCFSKSKKKTISDVPLHLTGFLIYQKNDS